MEELKPCPFCGGEARLRTVMDDNFVECSKCWTHGPHILGTATSKEEAAFKWNRRAATSNDPLTLEEFEHECDLWHESGKERWLWYESKKDKEGSGYYKVSCLFRLANITNYGKTWLAYARKPE